MTVWVNEAAEHALTITGVDDDGQLATRDQFGTLETIDPEALAVAYRPCIPGFVTPDWLPGRGDAGPVPEGDGPDVADQSAVPPSAPADVTVTEQPASTPVDEPVDDWDVEDPDPDYPEWTG